MVTILEHEADKAGKRIQLRFVSDSLYSMFHLNRLKTMNNIAWETNYINIHINIGKKVQYIYVKYNFFSKEGSGDS